MLTGSTATEEAKYSFTGGFPHTLAYTHLT